MKCMFALLWVLFFLPGVMAGDYIVQDIQLTNSGTATVVMSNSNSWTVADGQDAYVEQNIEFAGTSLAGDVYQDANNYIDLTTASPAVDNIVILQSITQVGVANVGSVFQDAYNLIDGDVGDDAYVSQTIDQEAGAGEYVDQEAANTINGDLGSYDTVEQSIYQVADAGDDVYQDVASITLAGNWIDDIKGSDNEISQGIDQLALSVDGNVYQYAAGGDYSGNFIKEVSDGADYNTVTQGISQAAQAQYDVYQYADGAYPDYAGNMIYEGIFGDSNVVAQEIEQLASSDASDVYQEAGYSDMTYWSANFIYTIGDSLDPADGNEVTQEVLQAAQAYADVTQIDTKRNNLILSGINGDLNIVDQDVTQVAGAYTVDQFADYANYVDAVYGDNNAVAQDILQLAEASSYIEQSAGANNVAFFVGDDFGLDQGVVQAGISNDVFQIAEAANGVQVWVWGVNGGYWIDIGDDAFIDQYILQLALAGDNVQQDAISGDLIGGTIIGDYAEVEQEIAQVASGYQVDQFAVGGNYLNEIYGYAPTVSQDILQVAAADDYVNQYADYGNEIYDLEGDYASVYQAITQGAVADEVYQDSYNLIYDLEGAYPVTYQEIDQAAEGNDVVQLAYNDVFASLYTDADIYQYIDSYADWGTSLFQDMANYAEITGLSDATVVQEIYVTTTPDGGVWNQANTIVDDITGTLYETQINVHNGNNVGNNFIV